MSLTLCLLLGIMVLPYAHKTPWGESANAQGGGFRMRVDVELVPVDVVALDKKGVPVPSLKKENFQLLEDGKPQEILSFDEMNGNSVDETSIAALGRTLGGKKVLILFDDRAITPSNLVKIREAAGKFVKEHMKPGDFFAVISNYFSLQILQNFTDDPEKILAAIRRPAVAATTAGDLVSSSGKTPENIKTAGGSNLILSLDSLSQSLERIRGRKSVLLFSENVILDANENTRNLYKRTVDSAKRANTVFFTVEPQETGLRSLGEAAQTESGPYSRYRALAEQSAQSTQANPVFSSDPKPAPTDQTQQDFLRPLANDTGGFPILSSNELDRALNELDRQLSSYYILGFQSNNPKRDGSYRKLEVKTDLKDITLRFRTGYIDRRPLDLLNSTKQEKALLDAIASPAAAVQLPISMRAFHFYDSPNLARAIVFSRIRLEKAEFTKKEGQQVCDLNVMGVAYGANDTVAARFSETVHVAGENSKEQKPQTLVYRNFFKLRPGKYRLKFAVSDASTNLGSIENPLEIPALVENSLSGSSLVVAEGSVPLPELIRNLNAQLLDDSDPLTYKGLEIYPSIENRFPAKSPIGVLFKIYNPSGDLSHWRALVKPRLVAANAREVSLSQIPVEQNLSGSDNGEAAIGLILPTQNVEPGKYSLIIEVSEPSSSRSTSFRTEVEFTRN